MKEVLPLGKTAALRAMRPMALVGLAYGVVVLFGGVVGYASTGSVASAVAGLVFGAALLGSALAMWRDRPSGWYAALGLAAVLTLFFGHRVWQGAGFVPAGSMAILSLAALILFIVLRRRPA